MKKLLITLLIGCSLYNCNNSKRSHTKITQLIPENATIVLSIKNIEAFKSDLKNNSFFKYFKNASLYNDLSKSFEGLDQINTNNNVLVCFNKADSLLNYTILTKYHDSLLVTNPLDSLKFASTVVDSIFALSPSKSNINSLQINEDPIFSPLEYANVDNSTFSIYLNKEHTNVLAGAIVNNTISPFANWSILNIDVSPDQVNLNGLSISQDTLPKFINTFKGTIPQENIIQNIVPLNSDGFISFTYDDFEAFNKNLSVYNGKETDSTTNYEILETVFEVAEVYKKNDTLVVLSSIDALSTHNLLKSEQRNPSIYRNVNIYKFENDSIFKNAFYPLISTNNLSRFINIDNHFVFGNNDESLHNIITNYQNGTVVGKNKNYKQITNELSDESSLLVVANSKKLKIIFEHLFKEDLGTIEFKNYGYSGFQLVQDDGFIHINGIIKKNKSRTEQHSITEEFNVTLDADLLSSPQFVINHRTKQKEVVVQDINNVLYLISNRGKVLWKKQLSGPVLGSVQQIDLFKNGRLQLAFATPKRIHTIDRNGKDVSPYPLRFNNTITQPLSLFDYDNRKDYRFLVTQNNVLIMYDKKGTRLKDFRYRNTSESIITQPKHFRINNKDYIVFGAGAKMHILNRRGDARINVNESIDFSGNDIFKYNNLITTTNKKGELVQVNLRGVVSKQVLNLSNSHSIVATSKTLASISENQLSIKQRSQELDFGNYTKPIIFYVNDKIYVSVTDLQAQKVYLFDSQSKPITNFPVYGNSLIDLANIDGDSNLEFVTKGESNSVIVYQKN